MARDDAAPRLPTAYASDGGRVRVGGVPLENLSRADIGKLVGYVEENPFVFHGTIEENIAYGVEDDGDSRGDRGGGQACASA